MAVAVLCLDRGSDFGTVDMLLQHINVAVMGVRYMRIVASALRPAGMIAVILRGSCMLVDVVIQMILR